MKSKLFNLNLKDILRGALVSAITIISVSMLSVIESNNMMLLLEWAVFKPILLAGLGGFFAYLLKNLLTNSNDKGLRKELKTEPKYFGDKGKHKIL